MPDEHEVLEAVRTALNADPHLQAQPMQIVLGYQRDGAVTLDGEVASVAAKKRAVALAAQSLGLSHIVDRLRVIPSEPMDDRRICDMVAAALIEEPVLAEYRITGHAEGLSAERVYRDSDTVDAAIARGTIGIIVSEGVVTLDGEVERLDHKRLAGALAWWVPGSRDVVNALTVTPTETDSDEALQQAVRLVLERDPMIDADGITVSCRAGAVRLAGSVAAPRARDRAEADAWSVLGVNAVVNEITIGPS